LTCTLRIGCCGFPYSRKKYYKAFDTVEVQQTFYDPPSTQTLHKWRTEAPDNFKFTIKAWQAISHSPRSPTWRRIRRKLPGSPEAYGLLKLTNENKWAWEITLEAAHALRAPIIVIQTPPSFNYNNDNAKRAQEFLSWAAQTTDTIIAWEPRGTWRENPDAIRRIVCRNNIIHVTDPLRTPPVICEEQHILYFRLHGLGGKEVNYRYKYTETDLQNLINLIRKYTENQKIREVYVMFNNIHMADNATQLKNLANKNKPPCKPA